MLNTNIIRLGYLKIDFASSNPVVGETVYVFNLDDYASKNIIATIPVVQYNGYYDVSCKMRTMAHEYEGSIFADVAVHNRGSASITHGKVMLFIFFI